MQVIYTTGLITINATMIIQLISFLLFLFILNRLMLQPLRKTMGERDRYMDQMRQDTLAAEEKLIDYSRQIEVRRNLVRSEAFSFFKQLEEEARAQAHDISISVSSEINAMREKAEKEISVRIAEARKSIFDEAEPLALCMMEQVLERKVSP